MKKVSPYLLCYSITSVLLSASLVEAVESGYDVELGIGIKSLREAASFTIYGSALGILLPVAGPVIPFYALNTGWRDKCVRNAGKPMMFATASRLSSYIRRSPVLLLCILQIYLALRRRRRFYPLVWHDIARIWVTIGALVASFAKMDDEDNYVGVPGSILATTLFPAVYRYFLFPAARLLSKMLWEERRPDKGFKEAIGWDSFGDLLFIFSLVLLGVVAGSERVVVKKLP